jgi:hypothetical protein
MGGLVKCHFLIDFGPKFFGNFGKKIQDIKDYKVGQKSIFYLKNSKSEIFKKFFHVL